MDVSVRVQTITGEAGQVFWGYHPVATVTAWSITKTEAGDWALTGSLVSADTFRVSQHPLVFVAPNGWRWPVLSLQITDASLLAMLGPKEKPDVPIREAGSRSHSHQ